MIRLTVPDITASDIQAAAEVLATGQLIQGPSVAQFENRLAEYTGIPTVVVSSGTAALHLALLASGIGRGDAVLVPAFTFPATANVVEQVGATAVFSDVEAGTYVASPDLIADAWDRHTGPRIRAIMPVSEFGCPADGEAVSSFAAARGAVMIEDAACAFGTVDQGHHPGARGQAACLSFHPRKAITTGDGGAILSRDDAYLERVRRLRAHGMVRSGDALDFVAPGLNYRMTEFQAALAIGQLQRYPRQLEHRRTLANRYLERLSGIERLSLPTRVDGHSWQTFMVVFEDSVNRDEVRRLMSARGIETNLGAQALNCLTWFRDRYALTENSFPTATRLFRHGLALPLHGKLSLSDVDCVCDTLVSVLRD